MDSGAEMEAGGRAGMEQSPVAAARLGKELSTNWLRPVSGNLATGLAFGTPSFRSSWQSVVNAWRGVSRGTNGVESADASEAGTVDTMNSVPKSHAEKNEQTSASAQAARSSFQSNGAVTQQNASVAGEAGQKEAWSDTGRSAWKAMQYAGTQTTSTGSTDATATERPGTANRNRVGPAAHQADQENTAQAATVGAQTIAPAIEEPIQLPASLAQSQISRRAQTAEAISASEPNFVLSNWRSRQFSGSAQLPGAEELASAATGAVATGAAGSGTAAGVRTHTMRTGPALTLRNAAQSETMHETAALSLDDADEPAASQQISSLSSPEARSAESRHEQSNARTSVTNEGLSGQAVPSSTTDNRTYPSLADSGVASATALATVSGPVQASADMVEDHSKQLTDRAMPRAANRNAAGEAVPGATPVAAAQLAGVDAAASSGLRIPGAPHSSTASATDHEQAATATSAAAPARDTFSALDAGTSLGTPAWTHAGSQHAEAGFRDPALGWVGVRADLKAGGIHATLVPSSAEAAQALNGHLAGLSTHLVEQQSPVASLSMASPGDNGIENGMGQRMQQGAEGNPQGNAPEESQAGSQESAPPAPSTFVQAASGQAGNLDPLARTGELRGTHISVMA